MQNVINQLKTMIQSSNNIVFFGGAGVSTESGIPDFRSVDGLYNQSFDYPPETILSHDFFFSHTAEYYAFHKTKLIAIDVKPNPAHIALAKLEQMGKLKAVITQNIDGLHQKAGSQNVYELHGSSQRNYCLNCGEFYSAQYIQKSEIVPKCKVCGGLIKPDIVLYGEGLNQDTINAAVSYIAKADMLIIGGTSLAVYPAASLIEYFSGKYLVLINKGATPRDTIADLVIREPIGEVLSKVLE